jgi:methyl-accepting chemotaxis protein
MGALRQMKASLLHSKLDYEGQINAIAKVQGVIECTPGGEVINANEIFLKLVGYTLEDVRGKNYSMFVDAAVRGTHSYQDSGRARTRREPPGRYRKVTTKAVTSWVQGVYNPILDCRRQAVEGRRLSQRLTKQREEAILNAASAVRSTSSTPT